MNEAVNQGGVNVTLDDRGLATVEFFHPMSNSLPGKVLAQLANTITELGENDAVKLILVKSAGERAFCAGASFDERTILAKFQNRVLHQIEIDANLPYAHF